MQSRRNIGKPERYKDDEHELHLVDTGDTESLFTLLHSDKRNGKN